MSVVVVEAIMVEITEGEGTTGDPARRVQYFYRKSTLEELGKVDSWLDQKYKGVIKSKIPPDEFGAKVRDHLKEDTNGSH